jgi:hypothetical protein
MPVISAIQVEKGSPSKTSPGKGSKDAQFEKYLKQKG